jgi:LysM repeat protein
MQRVARYAAPAAFLVAVTVAVLLVRSGLENGTTRPSAATTVATTTAATTAPPATTTEPPPGTTAEAEYYEIQSGDTLALVAERYGTTVEQLLVLNPDVDPVALTIGQRIRVK